MRGREKRRKGKEYGGTGNWGKWGRNRGDGNGQRKKATGRKWKDRVEVPMGKGEKEYGEGGRTKRERGEEKGEG